MPGLYDQSRARQAWIEATRDIATEFLSGTDPAAVFRLVADEALKLSDAQLTFVAVPVDDDTQELNVGELLVAELAGEMPELTGPATIRVQGTRWERFSWTAFRGGSINSTSRSAT